MKNCSNCKHRDKFITEEPCFTCKYTEKWEPKDEDDNESGSDRNINYIYGMVSPDIQRSLDLAIKVLKEKEGRRIQIMRIMTRTQYDAIVDIVTEQQKRIRELETELEKRKQQVSYLNELVFKANDRYISLHHKAVEAGLKIDFPATHKLHEDNFI